MSAPESPPTRLSDPPCSVVIGTRNRPGLLRETVESILRGTVVPHELIVVDQSDPDAPDLSALELSGPGRIHHVRTEVIGLSRAKNEGVRIATHDHLVFTDDDVEVDADWLERLLAELVRVGPSVVVTGRVLPARSDDHGGFVPSTIEQAEPARYRGRTGQNVIYHGNLAAHRSLLDAVGPLDVWLGPGARFHSAEDNDFCHRLLEAGFEIQYLPSAVVHHKAWRSLKHYLPHRWAYGRGQGAFLAKHWSSGDPYVRGRFVEEASVRLRRALRRWRQPLGALGELVQLLGLLSGAVEWRLSSRRRRSEGSRGGHLGF